MKHFDINACCISMCWLFNLIRLEIIQFTLFLFLSKLEEEEEEEGDVVYWITVICCWRHC